MSSSHLTNAWADKTIRSNGCVFHGGFTSIPLSVYYFHRRRKISEFATRNASLLMSMEAKAVEHLYEHARQQYAAVGVDAAAAIDRLSRIPISLHCWQGDDVGGFENTGSELGGGLAVTGNYPGKARTADELRADLEKATSLIPGRHRLNLHASYAETGGKRVERDELEPAHLQ